MTQVHFTFESEEIQAIINESGANDTAKTLMTIMFNQLMEEQRNQYIQANAYERSEERQSQRNGYYDRSFTTRIGTLELHVPRTRDGKFSPTIFERYQRSEKALIAAMIEMVISGVSTRKVTKTVELLTDGATVSKSFVSNLMKQLDPFVFEWRNRSLEAKRIIFSIVVILPSTNACSSLADSYSEFSERSPKPRAILIRSMISPRLTVFSSSGIPFFNRSFNEVCSA
ncbi:hypothetical protein EfmAA818_09820 [Enterococcus faecium]|nr:hypothetical protein EfmAA818_09820 [Enterococcus faecium]